jgi:Fe-Mn family superoxide dismutase
MSIQFPPLPYPADALQPSISKNTMAFHYGKHHRKYVLKLNELIKDTPFDKMELEEIIIESFNSNENIFNNAAQAWNHNFYWHCMTPKARQDITSDAHAQIIINFGSLENLKFQFTESAKKLFGSGWTWLVLNPDGNLSIENFKDADTPIVHNQVPLLTCDVWEHAYYLDYQNERSKYLNNFWELVDWHFVDSNMSKATSLGIKKIKSEMEHNEPNAISG